jgi:hypothetical protein
MINICDINGNNYNFKTTFLNTFLATISLNENGKNSFKTKNKKNIIN